MAATFHARPLPVAGRTVASRPAVASPGGASPGGQSDANIAAEIGAVVTGGAQDGVTAAYSGTLRTVAFTNTDKGSVAVAAHEALPDPHPQYATATALASLLATVTALSADLADVTTRLATAEATIADLVARVEILEGA